MVIKSREIIKLKLYIRLLRVVSSYNLGLNSHLVLVLVKFFQFGPTLGFLFNFVLNFENIVQLSPST